MSEGFLKGLNTMENIHCIGSISRSINFIAKERLKIKKVSGTEDIPLPEYKTEGSVGMDLMARDTTILKSGQRYLMPVGISVDLESNQYIEVVPRSGLAHKFGITILNSPGIIDSDYRGEIHANLINLGERDFVINRGDRVAQMILKRCIRANFLEVDTLSITSRNDKGHGSTGGYDKEE